MTDCEEKPTMDKEMMNRIYEAMKADSMSELNLEDLDKVPKARP